MAAGLCLPARNLQREPVARAEVAGDPAGVLAGLLPVAPERAREPLVRQAPERAREPLVRQAPQQRAGEEGVAVAAAVSADSSRPVPTRRRRISASSSSA
jgi:hypothetical protein